MSGKPKTRSDKGKAREVIRLNQKGFIREMNKIANHGLFEQGHEQAVRMVQESVVIQKGLERRRPTPQEASQILNKHEG